MKALIALLLWLPLVAAAAEELPDSASVEEEDPAAMAERFNAPPMGSEEMQSLYLKSPVQLENAEEKGGLESLSDEDRYKETDLYFRELKNSENLLPLPSLEPENRAPDTPQIPITPMREL